jgi:DNA-binding response OmpR family regulator
MRTLIVDDDPAVRLALRHVLEAAGHAVVEAETWLEAAVLLETRAIELAVVDGRFPKGPGAGEPGPFGPVLCRQARGLGVRTILLSGDDALVAEAVRAGFPALRKPFTLRALTAAVEAAIAPEADPSRLMACAA